VDHLFSKLPIIHGEIGFPFGLAGWRFFNHEEFSEGCQEILKEATRVELVLHICR